MGLDGVGWRRRERLGDKEPAMQYLYQQTERKIKGGNTIMAEISGFTIDFG